MVDSPAYRLNHEEVIKALEEGITFAENLNPIEAVADERGAVGAMVFAREARSQPMSWRGSASRPITLPARTVLVAAGTTPNMTYEKECPGTFQLDAKKKFFQPHRADRRTATAASRLTPDAERLLHVVRSATAGSSRITATTIPRYAGNVVKAMASAKDGFPHVVRAVRARSGVARRRPPGRARRGVAALGRRLDAELLARGRGGRPADADDRRGHRQGARRGAALPSRSVLPAAELRDRSRARERGRHDRC